MHFTNNTLRNSFVRITSNDLCWILIICGVFRLLFYLNLSNTDGWFPDTASYINFPFNIFKGEISDLRTPIYPYFIKIIKVFSEDNLLQNIKIVQSIISFLTINAFYNISKILFKKRAVTVAVTLVYGLNPSIINYDFCVLTESLSLNAAVVFLYLFVNFIQKPNVIKSISLTIFTLFLIMLRPSFLFTIGIVIIFWGIRFILLRKELAISLSGLTTSFFVVLSLIGYTRMNNEKNGCKALTCLSTVNQFENLSRFHLLDSDCDNEISKVALNYYRNSENTKEILYQNLSYNRMSKFVRCCIFSNFTDYAQNTWHKIIKLGNETTRSTLALNENGLWGIPDIYANLFSIRFLVLYIFLLFDLVISIYIYLKYYKILWIKIFIWLFIVGQFFTIIIGSFAEYQRLFSIALPFVTVLFFYYIDLLIFSLEKIKLREYLGTIDNHRIK